MANGYGIGQYGLYTYGFGAPALTLTAISINTADKDGGTPITFTGTGFDSTTLFYVNNVLFTGVVIVSATSATALTPANPVGTYDIKVANNTSTTYLRQSFSYTTYADIVNISPIDYQNLRILFRQKPVQLSALDKTLYSIDGGISVNNVTYETDYVYIVTTGAMLVNHSYNLTSTVIH